MTRDEAIRRLAIRLFESFEHHDPSDPPLMWHTLDDDSRYLWMAAVDDMLADREAIMAALG